MFSDHQQVFLISLGHILSARFFAFCCCCLFFFFGYVSLPFSLGIIFLFFWVIFLAMPHGFQDLSFLTRDWSWATSVIVLTPNHWTAREFPFRNNMTAEIELTSSGPLICPELIVKLIFSENFLNSTLIGFSGSQFGLSVGIIKK